MVLSSDEWIPMNGFSGPNSLADELAEPEIQGLFVASPGHLLVDGNWSVIGHRLDAAFYGEAYLAIYSSRDPDPHS